MSQSTIKKHRKEVRKAVRENIGEGLAVLSNMVRERPKYVPRWMWIVVYMPLFSRKYIKYIYKYMK
jgi:hypothetical protein